MADARDNQYIAAIQVSDLSGTKIYGNALPDATEKGQRTSTTIDLAGALIGETCLVMVADYADNVTIYELTYGGESEDYTGRMFGFTSGIALPSQADIAATERLSTALDAVGIVLADHIIVSDEDFVSMAASGVYRPPQSPALPR